VWVSLLIFVMPAVAACSDSDDGDGSAAAADDGSSTTDAPDFECTPPPTGDRHMTVAGEDRAYRVALPDDLTEPAPVLVLFHGFTSDIELMSANTGLTESGPGAGVVVVVPQAAGNPSSWRLVQGFEKDQAFLDAMLEGVTASDCVDADRIWLGGFSAGSAFTGRYGCAAPGRFEGLLMASGLPPPLCPEELDSPRVLVVHGTADPVVSFEGGPQAVNETTIELASVPESVGQWAERAGCAAVASEQREGEASLVSSWGDCTRGGPVDLIAIEGGDHTWPGSAAAGDGPGAELDLSCVTLELVTDSAIAAADAAEACLSS
jgi:polyhydroxybutyrate depolymerase